MFKESFNKIVSYGKDFFNDDIDSKTSEYDLKRLMLRNFLINHTNIPAINADPYAKQIIDGNDDLVRSLGSENLHQGDKYVIDYILNDKSALTQGELLRTLKEQGFKADVYLRSSGTCVNIKVTYGRHDKVYFGVAWPEAYKQVHPGRCEVETFKNMDFYIDSGDVSGAEIIKPSTDHFKNMKGFHGKLSYRYQHTKLHIPVLIEDFADFDKKMVQDLSSSENVGKVIERFYRENAFLPKDIEKLSEGLKKVLEEGFKDKDPESYTEMILAGKHNGIVILKASSYNNKIVDDISIPEIKSPKPLEDITKIINDFVFF